MVDIFQVMSVSRNEEDVDIISLKMLTQSLYLAWSQTLNKALKEYIYKPIEAMHAHYLAKRFTV